MIDCCIGLGANLGDRMSALAGAVERLAHQDGFALRALSRVWESEAVGPPQPRYLNAVARVGSMLSPRATLQRLLEIEEKLGRIRRERWGPRELDLDLLLYGNAIARGPVELPHPRLHERAFVLGPLCEVAPELRHPKLNQSVRELWSALPLEARSAARPLGPLRRSLDGPEMGEVEAGEAAACAAGAAGLIKARHG